MKRERERLGHFHEGYPAITVIIDSGLPSSSEETGKLLHNTTSIVKNAPGRSIGKYTCYKDFMSVRMFLPARASEQGNVIGSVRILP